MAAPSCVLTVIKKMTYRGNTNEEWSNTYAFTGGTPADATAWRSLFDALVLQEKTLYKSDVSVVAGYGYDKVPQKGDHAVWSVDLTVSPNTPVPGTYTGGGIESGGDGAAWVRWGLDRLNSKGKRVYVRKYFHPVYIDTVQNSGNGGDAIQAAWKTAAAAFGAKLSDGSFSGGRIITDPTGAAIVGHANSTWATTRTLKRRGKRPPTTP
jgi:hypothetical protein